MTFTKKVFTTLALATAVVGGTAAQALASDTHVTNAPAGQARIIDAPAEDGHITGLRPFEDGHATSVRPLEDGHATGIRPLEDGHITDVRPLEDGHITDVRPLEDGHATGAV
ncbi:hypothetical protein MTQ13_22160 [Streptomyces sp. XM4011]|uniref:hypothetical protein n=1 Tax=Streptomyces sp. XM4011 TaxID=2929780 RepID=UPI001FFB4710|nr:hypothetical protein [Streptomyces sp. XM4011]MCK1816949.1 hypothetical protein [Streptomyces sp. XM4011]